MHLESWHLELWLPFGISFNYKRTTIFPILIYVPEEETNLFQRLWGIAKQHTGGTFSIVAYAISCFVCTLNPVICCVPVFPTLIVNVLFHPFIIVKPTYK